VPEWVGASAHREPPLTVHGAGGATGEEISEAPWPVAPPGHGTRQRNTTLHKARKLLCDATGLTTPMWIILTAGRYHLDPALIGTDLQRFQATLETARTAGDDQARLAVARYQGPLADGADGAEPSAETARRRAMDAWVRIAEILQPADPDQALAALEAALTRDPCKRVHLPADHAAAGRTGHGCKPRGDGGYVVYRTGGDFRTGVRFSRLSEAFPKYAGHRYVDPDNPPG
jgi:hypothetical protein